MAVDRLALCIGINQYANPNARLSGCVNDAVDWADLLTKQGYSPITLLDAEATRLTILGCLENLVSRLGYRDRLVVQYSGHGSYVPDASGDEANGYDEVWVSQDMAYIADDDLERIFSKKPFGSRITLLSDSCFSGTINKFVPISEGKRKVLHPSLLDLTYEQAKLAADGAAGPRTAFTGSKYSTLISGCSEEEYSYDAWFGTRPNGAFTRTAIDTFIPNISVKDWYSRIREILPSAAYDQTPQLQASYYQSHLMALA